VSAEIDTREATCVALLVGMLLNTFELAPSGWLAALGKEKLCLCSVGLIQLVRFLVIKLTHLYLNTRFNMSVAFTINYFLVGGNVSINNETFLMTDFVNLKIKPAQFFRDIHRDMMYICVFIRLSKHIYIYILVS
jgi:hypothetical protein